MKYLFYTYLIAVGIVAGAASVPALGGQTVALAGGALGGGVTVIDWYVETKMGENDA